MENQSLIVSSTPHIRSHESIQGVMRDVLIALAPAAIMGIRYFGAKALVLMIVGIASSMFFEYIWQKGRRLPVTLNDLSAAVTGLLLAMNMPASAPFWMPIIGSAFAIILCKQLYGGLGQNFINPALTARAFLLASYPTEMTSWISPIGHDAVTAATSLDAVTVATPLALLKSGTITSITQADYMNALTGNIAGCLGETCAIALIIGGVYLIARRIISWRIPVVYIAVVFVLTALIKRDGVSFPLYEILTGGLMLGAFFMATDYTTSPVTPMGQIYMAIGCGLLTSLIRIFGGYPEGVSYSILIMNLTVPLLDRFTKPRVFGEVKKA